MNLVSIEKKIVYNLVKRTLIGDIKWESTSGSRPIQWQCKYKEGEFTVYEKGPCITFSARRLVGGSLPIVYGGEVYALIEQLLEDFPPYMLHIPHSQRRALEYLTED